MSDYNCPFCGHEHEWFHEGNPEEEFEEECENCEKTFLVSGSISINFTTYVSGDIISEEAKALAKEIVGRFGSVKSYSNDTSLFAENKEGEITAHIDLTEPSEFNPYRKYRLKLTDEEYDNFRKVAWGIEKNDEC